MIVDEYIGRGRGRGLGAVLLRPIAKLCHMLGGGYSIVPCLGRMTIEGGGLLRNHARQRLYRVLRHANGTIQKEKKDELG